jgi:pSer/pThr/pTyr-binding forkhead associated (FHA) protein
MSDMEDFVDVVVTRDGREISSGCFKLPITIGRMAQNSIPLGSTPPDKTISRVHAQIERVGNRLRLVDRSANGTNYRGRLLKGGDAVDLEDRDNFEIRGYEINVARAEHDPAIPVLFEAHILVDETLRGKPLLIGQMIMLCVKTKDSIRFDQAPVAAAQEHSILTRHRLDGESVFAVAARIEGQGMLLTLAAQDRPAMMLNRRLVTEPTLKLYPRDVIEIGKVRIELYPPGEKSLKCPNPSCQLLNVYNPHANCRFCSTRLVEGVTRIASATDSPR